MVGRSPPGSILGGVRLVSRGSGRRHRPSRNTELAVVILLGSPQQVHAWPAREGGPPAGAVSPPKRQHCSSRPRGRGADPPPGPNARRDSPNSWLTRRRRSLQNGSSRYGSGKVEVSPNSVAERVRLRAIAAEKTISAMTCPSHPRVRTANDGKRWVPPRRKRAAERPSSAVDCVFRSHSYPQVPGRVPGAHYQNRR
jgi:hypothetical protein